MHYPTSPFLFGDREVRDDVTEREMKSLIKKDKKAKTLKIGNKFMSDRNIRGYVGIRNQSILIHNLDPISHENYKVLKSCIYLYLVEFIGDKKVLESLLESAMVTRFLI